MAVKKNQKEEDKFLYIKPTDEVDVVSTKDDKVIVTTMDYQSALLIRNKNGWINKIFQTGFHNYKTNVEPKK